MGFATLFSSKGKMVWSGDEPDVIRSLAKDFDQEDKDSLEGFLEGSKPGNILCIGDMAIVRQPN